VVALLLAMLLPLQQLGVSARIDRDEVLVGDEVLLTVTVEAGGAAPLEIFDPDLVGLELINRRDRTSVSMIAGQPTRLTTRQFTFRALRAGDATIGPVRVQQGDAVTETSSFAVTVTPHAGTATGLDPRIEAAVEESPPPELSTEEVTLEVLAPPRPVMLGDQVDLVVVAWFPREVRNRLRNPPTLEPPSLRGAWTYDRATPMGVVASRQVNGRWYDLFVLHQVVFPLTAGGLEIGPATVSYSLPVSSSFLSRELRHEVQSEARAIAVRAQPRDRTARGYRGAAARRLQFRIEVPSGELRIGGGMRVRAELSGQGNVALWPEPELEWPVGLRAYPQEVNVALTTEDGRVGGTKVFDYLVVADSAGTHRVPAARYVYFDVGRETYVTLTAAPVEFVTPSGSGGVAPVQSVPPLIAAPSRSLETLADRLAWWMWLLVVLLPPLAAGAARFVVVWSRRRRGVPRKTATAPGVTLQQLDFEFRNVLEGLVPLARVRASDDLADALRAAGVEAPLAAHAARVRDRLRQVLYGPEGSTDPEELTLEVQEVLRALVGGAGKARPAVVGAVTAVLLAAVVAPGAMAQSAEGLYEAGAVRLAADSFAVRAAAAPTVAAHWYNLGAALDRLGEPVRARAAWLRAARLAPRDPSIRRALAGGTAGSAPGLTWVAPVTPVEAFALATVLWLVVWLVWAARARVRWSALLVTLALVVAGYGLAVRQRYARPVALVMNSQTPLRAAPYGPAPAEFQLEEGAPVRIEREKGAWVLVTEGTERGWLLRAEVVRL
jgi:hypothetical protein